jgi:hypothetical protein
MFVCFIITYHTDPFCRCIFSENIKFKKSNALCQTLRALSVQKHLRTEDD